MLNVRFVIIISRQYNALSIVRQQTQNECGTKKYKRKAKTKTKETFTHTSSIIRISITTACNINIDMTVCEFTTKPSFRIVLKKR